MQQILILASLVLTPVLLAAPSPTSPPLASTEVDRIIKDIQASLSPPNAAVVYHFKNKRADGTITEYKTRGQVRSIDLMHISFVEPAREKGREVLRSKDLLWTFVPSVGRIVKIEDKDSFAGGDFSNADILRIDWLNQYSASLAKETPSQWIIDLKARAKGAAYAQMRLWVKKKTRQPVQQEFSDSSGTLLKRLRYGSVQTLSGITRPTLLVMENMITGHRTELRLLDLKTKQKFPDSRFRTDNLGK